MNGTSFDLASFKLISEGVWNHEEKNCLQISFRSPHTITSPAFGKHGTLFHSATLGTRPPFEIGVAPELRFITSDISSDLSRSERMKLSISMMRGSAPKNETAST